MAEIEEVTILRVDTGEAVKNVQDLRDNIKAYKQIVAEAEIGSQEYQEAVQGLTQSQNALRNAMYASTASLDEVTGAAKGLGDSYNALVARMASLKQEFRATTDAARRADLGAQINAINQELKDLDALQGNFQRNVGDYAGQVKKALSDFPSFTGPVKQGLDDVNKTVGLLGKQPLFGIIALLAPVLTTIADKLKENETAMEAIRKVGVALQPALDAAGKAIEWLAEQLAKAADWFVELLGNSSETFKGIIAGAAGVGNVILNALLTPIRAAIEAVKGFGSAIGKVFKGDFGGAWESAKTAGQGIADAFRQGIDISANFDKGKEVAAKFIDGLGNGSKAGAKDAGREAGKAFADGMEEELSKINIEAIFARIDKARADRNAELGKYNPWAQMVEGAEEAQVALEALTDEELADLEAEDAALDQMIKKHKEKAAAMKQAWSASVSAVADIIGSLADIYEANADGSARAEERIKALRIASATISTIQGAIGAYMQAVASIPPPAGIIAGAAQAATVTAAGLANIAKIRATSLSGTSTSTAAPSFKGAAPVAALPVAQPSATPSALATLASDTQVLNSLGSQRVYILASDLEANDNARKVRINETTF